jgi:hypothetical protein
MYVAAHGSPIAAAYPAASLTACNPELTFTLGIPRASFYRKVQQWKHLQLTAEVMPIISQSPPQPASTSNHNKPASRIRPAPQT